MGRPIVETPVNTSLGEPSSFLENVPTDVAFTNRLPIHLGFYPIPGGSRHWQAPATLQVNAISYSRGAADDTMTLKWTPHADRLDTEHFADMLELFKASRRVDAYVFYGKPRTTHLLFAGAPQVNTIQWTDRSQSLTVTCLSDGQIQARYRRAQQILGRWMRIDPNTDWEPTAPDVREVTSLAPIFNCGGKPNRSVTSLALSAGGYLYPIHLFTEDNAPDARYWSYADALRYVAFWYGVNTGITVNTTDFLLDTQSFVGQAHQSEAEDPFIRDITRQCDDNVSIQSTNLDEAVAILSKRAGLDYQIGCLGTEHPYGGHYGSYRLRVFGRMADPGNQIDDLERHQLQPARRDLPRASPYYDFTGFSDLGKAEYNACNACNVSVDQRVVTYPIFLAGHRLFEASWLLRPGWPKFVEYLDDVRDPEDPDGDEARIQAAIRYWIGQFLPEYDSEDPKHRSPRSVFHAEHPNHAEYADIFRFWIWPDSAEIDAARFAREQGVWTEGKYKQRDPETDKPWLQDGTYGPGFPDSVAGHWVPHWRPFRDTIGRADTSTTARAPIVRIHFGNGELDEDGNYVPPLPDDTGWRRYMTDVHIDEHRAAIRFTDADIFYGAPFLADPTNRGGLKAIEQFIRGDFWVSVTACVRGDDRLKYAPAIVPPGPLRVQTIDLGFDRFQYNMRRLGNSHLNPQPVDTHLYENRNDLEGLAAFGDRMAVDMRTPSVAGFGSIFWLTRLYSPGDVITGTPGMSIAYERYPVVERVTWKNVEGDIQTELILTDLRSNPEVTA